MAGLPDGVICGLRLGRVVIEHLWSLAVANSGNRVATGKAPKRLEQAKTVATGCDQLPIGALRGRRSTPGSWLTQASVTWSPRRSVPPLTASAYAPTFA